MKWTDIEIGQLKIDFPILNRNELENKYKRNFDTIRKLANKLVIKKPRQVLYKRTKFKIMDIDLLYQDYINGYSINQLCDKYKLAHNTITKAFKRHHKELKYKENKTGYNKYKFDITFFEKIDSEAKAYILGFICADGCIYTGNQNFLLRININKKDIEVIEYIKHSLLSNNPIKYLHNNSIDIKFFSRKLISDLKILGCTERKSLTLQIPNINDNLLRHFLRGYFDGDGCITYTILNNRSKHFSISSSHDFCKQLQVKIKTVFNLDMQVYKRDKISILSSTKYSTIKKLYEIMYKDCSFFLKRKKQKFEELFLIL